VLHGLDGFSVRIRVLLPRAMAYQLLAGVGVLAFAQTREMLRVDSTVKPVSFGQLAVPLANNNVALLPVVLLRGCEFFGVVRLRLAGVEWFGDGQHGGLCAVEMKARLG
jgi:hypothetical protein